jgi:hypothetical protein
LGDRLSAESGGSGFYGLNVKQTDDLQSYKGINTLAFEAASFYLTQNDPNTDEAIVNFRGTAGGGGVTDHGSLTGLTDDDHTQYLLHDGTRAMSGNLNMGDNNIRNMGIIEGDLHVDGDVTSEAFYLAPGSGGEFSKSGDDVILAAPDGDVLVRPTNAVDITSSGSTSLKIGTTADVNSHIEIAAGTTSTPSLRFAQGGTLRWIFNGDNLKWNIQDIQAGNTVPFKLVTGSNTGTLTVQDSKVAIADFAGAGPDARLHVYGDGLFNDKVVAESFYGGWVDFNLEDENTSVPADEYLAVFRNKSDLSGTVIKIDSGKSSADEAFVMFSDRDTAKWALGKATSNKFILVDESQSGASSTAISIEANTTATGVENDGSIVVKTGPNEGQSRIGLNKVSPKAQVHIGGNLLVDEQVTAEAFYLTAGEMSQSGDDLYLRSSVGQVVIDDSLCVTDKVVAEAYYLKTGGEVSNDHGGLGGLTDDDHTQYPLGIGRPGGQTLYGSPDADEVLTLGGTSDPTLGEIRIKSQIKLDSAALISTPVDTAGSTFEWDGTFSTSDNLTLTLFKANYDWTTTGTATVSLFQDVSTINIDSVANPLNSLSFALISPSYILDDSSNTIGAVKSLGLNPLIQLTDSGSAPVAAVIGVQAGGRLVTTTAGSGATLTATSGFTGFEFGPEWATVDGTTVDFGDVTGFSLKSPAVGFFAPSAGTEQLDDYIGLRVENLGATLTHNGNAYGFLSELATGANRWMFRNDGGAKSSFGLGEAMWGTVGTEEIEAVWDGTETLIIRDTADAAATGVGFQVNVQSIVLGNATIAIAEASGSRIDLDSNLITNLDTIRTAGTTGLNPNGGTGITSHSVIHTTELPTQGTYNQAIWTEAGGRVKIEGNLNLTASTPSIITDDDNNYAIPTTSNQRTMLRLSTDGTRHLTGMQFNQEDDLIFVLNTGFYDLVLDHEHPFSTAGNRFIAPSISERDNFYIRRNEGVWVWHDEVNSRWRILDRLQHDSDLEDINAWSLVMRNDPNDGPRTDVKISDLTVEASPAAGDQIIVELASGELRKADVGALPGGGGGNVATDTIWDAKGDLAVATADNTAVALTVGADDTVLVADSSPAEGVSWAKVTHARSQDVGAYTIQMRNAGTSGVRADTKISSLTEAAVPFPGDWVLGEISTGELRRYDVSSFVSTGFYGINVKQSDDLQSFKGIETIAFEAEHFYINQNAPNTDEVVVNLRNAEKNTASNLGGGEGVFSSKSGVDLGGRRIIKKTGISLASDTDEITVTATGGGGGDVSSDAIWDAKGDLAGGTGADTAQRLAVGADDTMLIADSGETTGLKWGRAAFANIQDISTATMLGRDTAGSGAIEELTASEVRTLLNLVVGTDFQKSLSKTRGWEFPGSADDLDFFYTDIAITVVAVEGILANGTSTPSVDVQIKHSTNRSTAGNNVFGAARTVSSTTSGDDLDLTGGDTDIPAASFVWIETSAKTGNVPQISLTLRYTED